MVIKRELAPTGEKSATTGDDRDSSAPTMTTEESFEESREEEEELEVLHSCERYAALGVVCAESCYWYNDYCDACRGTIERVHYEASCVTCRDRAAGLDDGGKGRWRSWTTTTAHSSHDGAFAGGRRRGGALLLRRWPSMRRVRGRKKTAASCE
uniref:Uncharacterized protein n=1 Tax=Pseudictyota dubia TaxID=2749911 RepID=A0A7R9WIU3_9STRA|mmetsp:Transcript_6862/g.12301  ORF Transcript_6862/g.12301 Transcript_6862/m.12301 type:complete len:154 (+) Transcript_6862:549-1010(+)